MLQSVSSVVICWKQVTNYTVQTHDVKASLRGYDVQRGQTEGLFIKTVADISLACANMEEALSVRTAGVLQISSSEASYLIVWVDHFQRMAWNLPSITTRRKVGRNELIQTQISGDLNPPAHWVFASARGILTRLTTSGASLSEMQRVVCLRSPALAFICPASDRQYTTSQFDSLKFKVYFHVWSRWL
jgi:hypothetical protein